MYMESKLVYITNIKGEILFVTNYQVYSERVARFIMDEYNLNSVFVFEATNDYSQLHPATEAIELPSLHVISGDENL